MASDVGQHQMWLAQELLDMAPGSHLTSGGLGTMGYALPAAMGAAIGRPDRPVWAVAGDGGFQMNLQELATVVQERLPLRVAIIEMDPTYARSSAWIPPSLKQYATAFAG